MFPMCDFCQGCSFKTLNQTWQYYLFENLFLSFLIMCIGEVCIHEYRCSQGPEVWGPPNTGVIGGCELPDVSAGNQSQVL